MIVILVVRKREIRTTHFHHNNKLIHLYHNNIPNNAITQTYTHTNKHTHNTPAHTTATTHSPVLGDLALVETDGLLDHVLNLIVGVHVLHRVRQKQLAQRLHLL